MANANEYPKIRSVEPIPIVVQGERAIGLRDPHNLSDREELVVVSPETFWVATMMNGQNSISDIQSVLTRACGGVLFPREQIDRIVDLLEENLLLEGDRHRQALEAYREKDTRAAIIAAGEDGRNEEKFRAFFEEMMGLCPESEEIRPAYAAIAPHIDFRRAMSAYARVYRAVSRRDAEIYVVFGTSHYGTPETRFSFTRKAYETALGVLPTDRDFVSRVERKTSADLFADEISHKGEHSIEMQALFLRHIKGESARIVPILTGSLQDCVESGRSPMERPEFREVVEALRETAREVGEERVCWIAGADLSHVGKRFGDPWGPDEEISKKVREADMECLDAAVRKDAEGFFESLARHENRYRVCGLSAVYALLSVLSEKGLRGTLLEYDQSPEKETNSMVSFAAVAYECI